MIWLIILVRVISNPFSNVFQKILARRGARPVTVVLITQALVSVACLPFLFHLVHGLSRPFWISIAFSAILAIAGNALIVQALKLSELSLLAPINAYKSVVSLVPGLILLREVPTLGGMAGILLIVAGSYFIVDKTVSRPGRNVFVLFFRDRGVQYRFAALILSAIEAVYLKKALLVSSPLITFVFWSWLGFGFAVLISPLFGGRRDAGIFRNHPEMYLALALTMGLMQFSTILAFKVLHVSYALALFQMSSLLSVILGHKLFQERHVVERMFGAAVMGCGAILIMATR